jgi:hypothetical protein
MAVGRIVWSGRRAPVWSSVILRFVSGADDLQAAADLERVGLELPDGLELRWLGVSGYRLTYEGVSLFVDPYVSRVPLRALLLRRTALPDGQMIARYANAPGEVAGVLVGHTHFDHAVDAPALARRYATKAYGSASLVQLMRLHGLADLAVEVAVKQPYELGPFVVRFVPSRHSKLLFGRKVPMDGPLTCDHLDGLNPGAYKWGRCTASASTWPASRSTTRAAPISTTRSSRTTPSTCSWPGSPAGKSRPATGNESCPGSILGS